MPLDSRNADNSSVCKTRFKFGSASKKIMPVIAIFVFKILAARGTCDSGDFIGVEM